MQTRRSYQRKVKRESPDKYWTLLIIGIAIQVIVFIGSSNTVNMNGNFLLLLLVIGDPCLVMGFDYLNRKSQEKLYNKKN